MPERLRVGGLPLGTEENLVWNLISYFFQSYESYEIKFLTEISSFIAYRGSCVCAS